MRNAREVIARSVAVAGLALFGLVPSLVVSSDVASAHSSSQVTLDLDSPNVGITVTNGQRVLIGGWAGVPGGRDSGIRAVEVYLDGAPGTGTVIGNATLGIVRMDVASATHHPEWANSGYNLDWIPRNVSEGSHTLYVVARAASGSDTATQTVQVTGCGCGVSAVGSVTNPLVRRLGTNAWEIDQGGPGVLIQRDFDPYYGW